jgi:hypothetical protein
MYKNIAIIGLLLTTAALCAVKENNGWFKKLYSNDKVHTGLGVTGGFVLGAVAMKVISKNIKSPKDFAKFFGLVTGGSAAGFGLYKWQQHKYKIKN